MQEKLPKMTSQSVREKIPDRNDWGDISDDFDTKDAFDVFFGKSNQDARHYFLEDVQARTQELRSMPRTPFMYYLLGFCDVVLSGDFGAEHPFDIANCYMSIVMDRAVNNAASISSIFNEIDPVLTYLAENQESLGADVDIFGDFRGKSDLIRKLVREST
ncbi:hypothetical protein [Chitinimonas naiadis]